MAKSSNQKLKMLYLLKILTEQTDENHLLTAAQLIAKLAEYQVSAERKSIYDDVDCLIQFGYDIVHVKARSGGGYYLASREFELPELKLLVDAVQASRFITRRKSRELIAKIEKLAGPYDARQLQRQVLVAGRIKAENESIYYNVDEIHRAIQENMPISFLYLEWNTAKELQPRKAGAEYLVSPLFLTWKDENYYLVAFDGTEQKIKHFRVDKMSRITGVAGREREGLSLLSQMDMAEYTNRTFGMFGGEARKVTLLLPASMTGIILDRFGREVDIRVRENGQISARVEAAISGQFFGWLTGLGSKVSILSPEDVREKYRSHLQAILQNDAEKGRHDSGIKDSRQDEGV